MTFCASAKPAHNKNAKIVITNLHILTSIFSTSPLDHCKEQFAIGSNDRLIDPSLAVRVIGRGDIASRHEREREEVETFAPKLVPRSLCPSFNPSHGRRLAFSTSCLALAQFRLSWVKADMIALVERHVIPAARTFTFGPCLDAIFAA